MDEWKAEIALLCWLVAIVGGVYIERWFIAKRKETTDGKR